MGEIIHVNFKTGEIIDPKPVGEAGAIETKTKKEGPSLLLLQSSTFALEITSFLRSLQHHSSNETMSLRRDLVGNYSEEQVCRAILDSNEGQWTAQPAYYSALLERLQELLRQGLGLTTKE